MELPNESGEVVDAGGNVTRLIDPSSVVALLNLPAKTMVGLDGHRMALARDDFVGFYDVPSHGFHLVTTRSSGDETGITTAFLLSSLPLIRRFDAQTEEVSSLPVDDGMAQNLLQALEHGRIQEHRIVSYSRFVSAPLQWRNLTNFISKRLLQRRNLSDGAKIVPGAYEEDQNQAAADGSSIQYPAIPVIDMQKSSSIRCSQHHGTKQYLKNLSPSDRTRLFTVVNPADHILEQVLGQYYNYQWQDMLGDLQLAYILFLHVHCLSSLEHWRDLLAMLVLVDVQGMESHIDLYTQLVSLLGHQILTMERDFFEEVEISGDAFFLPAVRRLCSTLFTVDNDSVQSSVEQFRNKLKNRFPATGSSGLFEADQYHSSTGAGEDATTCHDMAIQAGIYGLSPEKETKSLLPDEDQEDGPIVVSNEEVDSSLARSSRLAKPGGFQTLAKNVPDAYRKAYPLLVAAMAPGEDVVMTCARVLHDASDVSLVREAADYLENVESKNDASL